MGNQCGGCAGQQEEGEILMKVCTHSLPHNYCILFVY